MRPHDLERNARKGGSLALSCSFLGICALAVLRRAALIPAGILFALAAYGFGYWLKGENEFKGKLGERSARYQRSQRH